MSQFTVIAQDSGKNVNIGDELQRTLTTIDLSGYVLLLRSNVTDQSEQQSETIHMFNVGNNVDELTDMLMAASEYLPSNAMKG